MSNILVNTIKDTGNNTLLSSDGSGSVTLGSGFPDNTPAFQAYLSTTTVDFADGAAVKIQFDTEVLDTDNCYDNSTNYRFTPTVAGKYLIYGSVNLANNSNGSTVLRQAQVLIYKNGSANNKSYFSFSGSDIQYAQPTIASIIDFNGTTDYVELYAFADVTSGTARMFGTSDKRTYFGAYRIIGA